MLNADGNGETQERARRLARHRDNQNWLSFLQPMILGPVAMPRQLLFDWAGDFRYRIPCK